MSSFSHNITASLNCTQEVAYLKQQLQTETWLRYVLILSVTCLVLIAIGALYASTTARRRMNEYQRKELAASSKRKKENKKEPNNAEQLLHVLDTTSDDLELSVELSALESQSVVTDHEIMTYMEEVKNELKVEANRKQKGSKQEVKASKHTI